MEIADTATLQPNVRAVSALVELRRKAFRFLDTIGKVADDLLSAYDTVTFDGSAL